MSVYLIDKYFVAIEAGCLKVVMVQLKLGGPDMTVKHIGRADQKSNISRNCLGVGELVKPVDC
jgi:hypothetical protein